MTNCGNRLGAQLAVDAGEVVLTYTELDERANQLARHLLVCGAGPGDKIALLFDESWRGPLSECSRC